ncbi:MAG: hypothetical protein ACI9R8_001829, partial [Candidatus Paceibacteria bacterium]
RPDSITSSPSKLSSKNTWKNCDSSIVMLLLAPLAQRS